MTENPILRGFNPDPSIIRINDDYYVAVSTFEWYGGVRIYHSRDLKHFTFHSCAVCDVDMRGVPDSGGIWAPCLSYDGERVFLVYTLVRERGAMMQCDNYIKTASSMDGEWSESVYLNSLGFDPSLFHDTDGRKWLVSLDNHYEKGRRFNGIWLTQYDAVAQSLKGETKRIYAQPEGELVEGAHIYHTNGYYYLLKAQGGTGERHSAQLSRSKNLFGPYEDDNEIFLHSRDDKSLFITAAGHADLVETPRGLYAVHLGTRTSCPHGFCYYGRETCIQKAMWKDGWLRLANGGSKPYRYVEEALPEMPVAEKTCHDFSDGKIPSEFSMLRTSIRDAVSFESINKKSALVLRGGDSLMSRFSQSLLARRIDCNDFSLSVNMEFAPDCKKHLAGITIYYDTNHWHALCVSADESGRCAFVLSCDKGTLTQSESVLINSGINTLEADVKECALRFYADKKGVGEVCDMHIVSSEHINLGFTGAMAGIFCTDLNRREKAARFYSFDYTRRTK